MGEVSVAKLTDIADGDYRIFAFDNIEVGIFRTGSKVLAYENICPHAGGPVCQGWVGPNLDTADGGQTLLVDPTRPVVMCAWHRWEFDVRTGQQLVDHSSCLRTYPVVIEGGRVQV